MNKIDEFKLSKKDKEKYKEIKQLTKTDLEDIYIEGRKKNRAYVLVLLMYFFVFLAIIGILVTQIISYEKQTDNYLDSYGKTLCRESEDNFVYAANTYKNIIISCESKRFVFPKEEI